MENSSIDTAKYVRGEHMKKSLKIILIMLIILLIVANISVYGFGLGDIKSTDPTGTSAQKVKDSAGQILGVIRTIGVILSVVMLIAIGIKYLMGSVEEKAKYKKTLMPYIIGAFIVFTGSLIPEIIYKMVK